MSSEHPEGVVSVSEMRDRIAHLQTLQLLRCAQALRMIRDTCPGAAANIAGRASEVERLTAERDRYREALERIRDMKDWDGFRMQLIADEVLG